MASNDKMSPIPKPILFLILASMVLTVSAAIGGRRGPLVGGWQPIPNPKDKYILEIAQFAVQEQNKKTNSQLKFGSVLKGEQQVVSGMNYRLYISAKDTANSNEYVAVVYDKPWAKLRSLTSFKQV